MGAFATVTGLLMICLGFVLNFHIQFGIEKSIQDIRMRDIFFERRITKDSILVIILFICGGIMLIYGLAELGYG